MFNLIKNTIKLTNDYIILATPLILFLWLLSLYISFTRLSATSLPLLLLELITIMCMMAAFCAAWFYMVKKAINISKQTFVLEVDKAKAIFNLIKTIPAGIGKYFFSYLGMLVFSIILCAILGSCVFLLGNHFIGNLNLLPEQIKNIVSVNANISAFVNSLSFEQLMKLFKWYLLILATTSVTSFFCLLWIPEIIYQCRNPFKAFFTSIKKILKKPLKAFGLFIFISLLNFAVSFINKVFMFNNILYFIAMVLCFYFIVYLVVLIFSYYDKEFNEK